MRRQKYRKRQKINTQRILMRFFFLKEIFPALFSCAFQVPLEEKKKKKDQVMKPTVANLINAVPRLLHKKKKKEEGSEKVCMCIWTW